MTFHFKDSLGFVATPLRSIHASLSLSVGASLAFRATLWLTTYFARLYLEHECITCTGNK